MPSISDILDAVSIPALIKDEIIRNGVFEKSRRGAIFYSGGFTVVFPVTANGEKWAFRCWHTEIEDSRKRYKLISDYINHLNTPYFCNFYYCNSGLVVDGQVFPTTRMNWVDGKTINQYILDNASNQELMLSLAERFLEMTVTLHRHHIAHGDLQHGNIIVTDSGDIRLVDYDSLFVPGLEGESDIIIGKAEYQHPKRKQSKTTSEKLDYFSELVIYLSILAVAYNPSIINHFSIDDSLLFQTSDWNDFEGSALFSALKSIGNDDITLLTSILSDYLKEENINNLRPFADIWSDLRKEPVIQSFECGKRDGVALRGLKTKISWVVENASRIFLNSKELPSNQTCRNMTFTKDSDVTLLIINGLHKIKQTKHIRVLDKPVIQFTSDKYKLKETSQGIEYATLNWTVANASSVELKCGNKILSTDISRNGFIVCPGADTKYTLSVTGLDNKTIFKADVFIAVRQPAAVNFISDKLYSLPGVPITITWDVRRAINIQLNNNSVENSGKAVFFPETDEDYTLSYEDEFGSSSTKLTVRMLPLPVIRTVLVDTPDINNVLGIHYSAPQFHNLPEIPSIETSFVKLQIPHIPDLNESGINVTLPETPKKKFSERFSRFFRNIFG